MHLRPAPARDRDAPLVLLWHGFGAPASARALAESLPLRGLPMWRAYVDLPLFGGRAPPAGADELVRREEEDYLLELVWPVVREAVEELPGVVDGLRSACGGEFSGGIGLFGFSAGGTAALLSLAERPLSLRAVVVLGAPKDETAPIAALERLAGIPYEWSDEARRAARRLDFVGRAGEVAAGDPPPALLLLHGEDDAVIPAGESRDLFEAFRPGYRESGHLDRLDLEVLPDLGHGFSASVGRHVRRWLQAHLGEPLPGLGREADGTTEGE